MEEIKAKIAELVALVEAHVCPVVPAEPVVEPVTPSEAVV
jgi:hypothetical protein